MPANELTAESRRLILQLERKLAEQARFRSLLAAIDSSVVGHRRELRAAKARLKRTKTKVGRAA
jgi:hypothetical protein